ncbi:hypothetical protein [Vulcanisaeta sp. JCM 16159]|nr:hypothetical protein [Vulcanisaeta sp. JCM 16159]
MDSSHVLFYISSALASTAAIASALRGQVYIYLGENTIRKWIGPSF